VADPTSGITCPDMRRIVREAIKGGWVFVRWTGTNHAEIQWPPTGQVLRFGATPSVASWKSLATEITKVSGVEVWRKGNRKRSRKGYTTVDPQVEAARVKHQSTYALRLARERQARALAAAERKRREIEQLMRP